MSDFMVRNLPESIILEIDRRAKFNSMSRQAYLHMFLMVAFTQRPEAHPEPAVLSALRQEFSEGTTLKFPELSITEIAAVGKADLLEYVFAIRNAFAVLSTRISPEKGKTK